MKSNLKKVLSVMLALVMLVSFIQFNAAPAKAAPETLVEWKPTSSPAGSSSHLATGGITANSSATLTLSSGGNITGVGTGDGTNPYAYTYNTWQTGGIWWQLGDISTTGYEDLEISFAVQSSNTGPRDFALEYSIDNGATWNPVMSSGTTVAITSANAYTPIGPYTLPVETEDCASLQLRTINTSNTSVGGGTVGSGGTSRISNISLIGTSTGGSIQPPEIDGSGILASWSLSTVNGTSIPATGGDYMSLSNLQFIKGNTPQNLNFSSGGANLNGLNGFTNDAYWYAQLSSDGFANMEVTWNMRSSSTGPRDFKLQYSIDGTIWLDAINPNIVVPSAVAIGNTSYTKNLPLDAMNQSDLYLRWLLVSEVSAGGGVIGSGGTHQINNIVISGDYILAADQLRMPTSDYESGAIPLGSIITFSPGSPDDAAATNYAILTSSDGGGTWNEATANQYTVVSLPLNLQVKASASGKTDSRISSYEFTHAKLPMVTSSRNSGAIIPGATIRLETTVAAATIMYRLGGAAAEIYTQPIVLDEQLFVGDPATLTVEAWATATGYITGDATIFTYTIAASGGERVYFGQLHSHTTNSDGIGSLTEAYNYAKNVAGLDFFAITDHSNSFDETGASSDNPASIDLDTYNIASLKWQAGLDAAQAARTTDFISVYGYEMTWSGGPGHMNTFNTDGFVSRNNATLNGKANDSGLRAYYEILTRHPDSISMFNHPGTTFGNFSNFAYYDPVIDQRISLIEVGNGEGTIGSGGYFRSYEQYTLALDKGWHLAPTNNQDNHLGKWGDSNTARTAIWTNDLSVEGLYQALRDMRVYATEVADLEIVYKVNGQPLGSILDVVPQSANFTAEIINPTNGNYVKSVTLVTNGGVEILRDTPNTQNYNYNKTISNPVAGYYYLRVIVSTPEGDRTAVTAPVWLGEGKAAGFVEVGKSTVMPVTGESLIISASLFNNESQSVTLLSLEYTDKSGTVLASYPNLNINIASAGEATHSFTYTPTQAGNETITVSAHMLFADGSDLNYSYDISYEVWDADKLVYIGVDASHYNEYVDGNYKDNMENFTAIAGLYGVRVNILWTSQELIDACANLKYQAMIFTAPSRRVDPAAMNPTTGQIYGSHRSYSQAELDAIAQFAQRGGTVVLTGWSNIYENYNYNLNMPLDEHMSSQQNKVLAAIGSTLRLSDDASMDSLQWSSQSDQYRLYLTDAYDSYSWTNPLLSGVDNSQIYSHYGGSTIYTVNPGDVANWSATPSSLVPSSVLPAVTLSTLGGESINRETAIIGSGNTNYRTDYTKHDGKFMILASETLDYGNGITSQVIASGGAFMSNFEVKIEMENSATLQYSNYNVALNLIMSIAPQAEITSIADAKVLPQGTVVTIEGIATSNVYSGNSASNTGFFDCIYVQDTTGGINLFPVSSGVSEGQKIRVTGTVSAYQGETQIAVTKLELIDGSINLLSPTVLTTADSMAAANTGLLVSVTGTVSDIVSTAGVVSQFTLTDSSGIAALVFINAYITDTVDLSFIEDGATVSVIGLASIGENNTSSNPLPRIRVRDRNEITLVTSPPVTYTITFDANGGTVNPATAQTGIDGKLATLPTPTRSGSYSFIAWFDSLSGTTAITTDTVFTANTTIYARWNYTGGGGGGGGQPWNPSRPDTQETPPINEPETPLTEKPWPVFTDLAETDWYYEAAKYVYNLDIMIGVADNRFGGESTLSRAMIVTILHRLSGEPSADGFVNDFTDVVANAWYTDAINWAVKNNIVLGYGDGRFGPNDPVTNEQLAALLYRLQLENSVNPLPDIEDIDMDHPKLADVHDYAIIPIYTLIEQGFLDDLPAGQFIGKNLASRASVASILYRYLCEIDDSID
ncbi:MAG: CehA/McbA family metallohydrolase [Oscillospiraceae bacterium]|nr:CehA/McbA family metallohydrolase [Oscillospiraceae bacterium]